MYCKAGMAIFATSVGAPELLSERGLIAQSRGHHRRILLRQPGKALHTNADREDWGIGRVDSLVPSSIGPLRQFGFFMGACITATWRGKL